MGLYRTEDILDKWQFGDVEIQDFEIFAQTQSFRNPNSMNANILMSIANEKNPDWKELDRYFLATIAEMGLPKPTEDRLGYIRSLFADDYNGLIQSITQDEIYYIAKKDYGHDFEEYRDSLNQLIFEQNGIKNENQFWFPYEVVSLGRWRVEPNHEREFAICNCLIAKNILWDTDDNNDIGYILKNAELLNEFTKLPAELLGTTMKCMITAFRYQESCNPHYFPDCNE